MIRRKHHHNVYVVRSRLVHGGRVGFAMVAVFTAEVHARNYLVRQHLVDPNAVFILDLFDGHSGAFITEITS